MYKISIPETQQINPGIYLSKEAVFSQLQGYASSSDVKA